MAEENKFIQMTLDQALVGKESEGVVAPKKVVLTPEEVREGVKLSSTGVKIYPGSSWVDEIYEKRR